MQVPKHYSEELALTGGSTWNNLPRYRLHWLGDPMPGCPDRKFESPCDCWALLQWVDTDSEHPDHGGGYVVLQPFRQGLVPCDLDSEGLNLRVLKMMVYMAEQTRHQFIEMRAKVLERKRQQQEKELEKTLADYLHAQVPIFTGPTSFGTGDASQTLVQKKMEQIERNLERSNAFAARMGRGAVISKR
jgi:hypothetical protein